MNVPRILPMIVFLSAGCGTEPASPANAEPARPRPDGGTGFDPNQAGRCSGQVTWNGPIPEIPSFLYGVSRPDGLGFEFRTAENPNRPQINPTTHAVTGAVVFLRGMNPDTAKPWNLDPVRVEIGNARITVVQGSQRGRVGVVRRGDAITAFSTEPVYHVLRGRGDGFFSLTMPEPNQPSTRTLITPGRVELSSGTGLYWVRADLFVSEHPYFAVTDAEGRFTLDAVPAGKVELVVWLPGWQVARQERDPDSTSVARQIYTPPLERVTTVTIDPTSTAEVNVALPR